MHICTDIVNTIVAWFAVPAVVSLEVVFAERAALMGPPPKVMRLRCGNQPTDIIVKLLRERIAVIEAFELDDAACLEIY